jgi:hypothetical protein
MFLQSQMFGPAMDSEPETRTKRGSNPANPNGQKCNFINNSFSTTYEIHQTESDLIKPIGLNCGTSGFVGKLQKLQKLHFLHQKNTPLWLRLRQKVYPG